MPSLAGRYCHPILRSGTPGYIAGGIDSLESIPGLPYRLQFRLRLSDQDKPRRAGTSPLSTMSLLSRLRRLKGVRGLSSKDTYFRLLIIFLFLLFLMARKWSEEEHISLRSEILFKGWWTIRKFPRILPFVAFSFLSLINPLFLQLPFPCCRYRESKWGPGKVQFYAANRLDCFQCFVHAPRNSHRYSAASVLSQCVRSALVSVDLSGLK